MLEALDVVWEKLETFKIDIYHGRDSSFDFDAWKRFFRAFLRISPKVVHYTVGDFPKYCSFSKESNQGSEPELASSLAFLMSPDEYDWRNALSAISTVRCE